MIGEATIGIPMHCTTVVLGLLFCGKGVFSSRNFLGLVTVVLSFVFIN
jgi:hypothetical protein